MMLDLDDLLSAVEVWVESKASYDAAMEDYDGYSFDWDCAGVVDDLDNAKTDIYKQLRIVMKEAVDEALAEREKDNE